MSVAESPPLPPLGVRLLVVVVVVVVGMVGELGLANDLRGHKSGGRDSLVMVGAVGGHQGTLGPPTNGRGACGGSRRGLVCRQLLVCSHNNRRGGGGDGGGGGDDVDHLVVGHVTTLGGHQGEHDQLVANPGGDGDRLLLAEEEGNLVLAERAKNSREVMLAKQGRPLGGVQGPRVHPRRQGHRGAISDPQVPQAAAHNLPPGVHQVLLVHKHRQLSRQPRLQISNRVT